MTDFEILFCVAGIATCVAGMCHLTITYRSITRNIDPDPERVRELLEGARLLKRRQGAAQPGTEGKEPDATGASVPSRAIPRPGDQGSPSETSLEKRLRILLSLDLAPVTDRQRHHSTPGEDKVSRHDIEVHILSGRIRSVVIRDLSQAMTAEVSNARDNPAFAAFDLQLVVDCKAE